MMQHWLFKTYEYNNIVQSLSGIFNVLFMSWPHYLCILDKNFPRSEFAKWKKVHKIKFIYFCFSATQRFPQKSWLVQKYTIYKNSKFIPNQTDSFIKLRFNCSQNLVRGFKFAVWSVPDLFLDLSWLWDLS